MNFVLRIATPSKQVSYFWPKFYIVPGDVINEAVLHGRKPHPQCPAEHWRPIMVRLVANCSPVDAHFMRNATVVEVSLASREL